MHRTQFRSSTSMVSSSFSDKRVGGAPGDDVVDQVLASLALDVGLDLLLVHLHLVAPGADHGEVGPFDGVHAVVGAAGDLELELVGQRGPVNVVDEVVHQRAVDLVLVGARLLAAGGPDARLRGAHTGTGAPQVEAVVVDVVEEVLGVLGVGADEHDVAGLAVEGDEPRPPLLPGVGELAQHVGGVVVAGRRLDPQGVELARGRELLADLGEAGDDATAVAVHADRAALPVPAPRLVRVLELAEEVVGDPVDSPVVVLVAQLLDP